MNKQRWIAALLLTEEMAPVITGTKATSWLGWTVEVLKNSYVSVGIWIAFPFESVGFEIPRDTMPTESRNMNPRGFKKSSSGAPHSFVQKFV